MQTLIAEDVSFRYSRSVPALTTVSLRISQGDFLSLVGPNGSGKTTLLRLFDRILLPATGRILLDHRSLNTYARREIARTIAFVPQDHGVLFPFTVEEIVLMGRMPRSAHRVFESSIDRAVAMDMMERADVAGLAATPVTALSGGERQRVFVARALAQQPSVILLDEPNAHLDIAHQIGVFQLLRQLNVESGLTVVSVSHDLNLAASFSTSIAVLAEGRLKAAGPPAQVITESLIGSVFGTGVLVDRHPDNNTPRVTLRM